MATKMLMRISFGLSGMAVSMFSCRSGIIPFVTASAKTPSMRVPRKHPRSSGGQPFGRKPHPGKCLKSFEKVTVIISRLKSGKDEIGIDPKSDINKFLPALFHYEVISRCQSFPRYLFHKKGLRKRRNR